MRGHRLHLPATPSEVAECFLMAAVLVVFLLTLVLVCTRKMPVRTYGPQIAQEVSNGSALHPVVLDLA